MPADDLAARRRRGVRRRPGDRRAAAGRRARDRRAAGRGHRRRRAVAAPACSSPARSSPSARPARCSAPDGDHDASRRPRRTGRQPTPRAESPSARRPGRPGDPRRAGRRARPRGARRAARAARDRLHLRRPGHTDTVMLIVLAVVLVLAAGAAAPAVGDRGRLGAAGGLLRHRRSDRTMFLRRRDLRAIWLRVLCCGTRSSAHPAAAHARRLTVPSDASRAGRRLRPDLGRDISRARVADTLRR